MYIIIIIIIIRSMQENRTLIITTSSHCETLLFGRNGVHHAIVTNMLLLPNCYPTWYLLLSREEAQSSHQEGNLGERYAGGHLPCCHGVKALVTELAVIEKVLHLLRGYGDSGESIGSTHPNSNPHEKNKYHH